MSETTVAVIEAVTSKEGATNGKPWRKFTVKTESGDFYSTFDKAVAENAHGLMGQRAELFWKPSGSEGQFKDILGAKAAGAAVTPDGIPSARTETGAPDWDAVGLRKTRCLLWAHFLQSPLALELAKDDGQKPRAHRLYDFGVAIISLAERDIYWRDPAAAEEDIPFD